MKPEDINFAYCADGWVSDTVDTIIEDAISTYFGHRHWNFKELHNRFELMPWRLKCQEVRMDGQTILIMHKPEEIKLRGEGGCKYKIAYAINTKEKPLTGEKI